MRSFLMLFYFSFWCLLFCACDEDTDGGPQTLVGTWILDQSFGLECTDRDQLYICDRMNCETLTFRTDQLWVRIKIVNGLRVMDSGKYVELSWNTVKLCSGPAACTEDAEGILYQASRHPDKLVLFRDKSESFSCQTVEKFVKEPLSASAPPGKWFR